MYYAFVECVQTEFIVKFRLLLQLQGTQPAVASSAKCKSQRHTQIYEHNLRCIYYFQLMKSLQRHNSGSCGRTLTLYIFICRSAADLEDLLCLY
jgi:hypothetical protein